MASVEVGVTTAEAPPCLRCPERLSQAEGDLEKEGKAPGDKTSLLNVPSAERDW